MPSLERAHKPEAERILYMSQNKMPSQLGYGGRSPMKYQDFYKKQEKSPGELTGAEKRANSFVLR